MSYDSLLIDTCDIEENTPGAVDGYGHKADSWTVLHDNEPCRLVSGRGREIKIGAEVVIADYQLFLGDIVVTEQNRIVMDGITYDILTVTDHKHSSDSHHKECYLRTVR